MYVATTFCQIVLRILHRFDVYKGVTFAKHKFLAVRRISLTFAAFFVL